MDAVGRKRKEGRKGGREEGRKGERRKGRRERGGRERGGREREGERRKEGRERGGREREGEREGEGGRNEVVGVTRVQSHIYLSSKVRYSVVLVQSLQLVNRVLA